MKIFAWLLMMALTWYLAGLYQMSALGLLLVVQLLLFVWMGMLSFYIKSAADAALIGKNLTVVRGQEAAIGIRIMNRGRLPLTRIRLRMEWSNPLAMDGGKYSDSLLSPWTVDGRQMEDSNGELRGFADYPRPDGAVGSPGTFQTDQADQQKEIPDGFTGRKRQAVSGPNGDGSYSAL